MKQKTWKILTKYPPETGQNHSIVGGLLSGRNTGQLCQKSKKGGTVMRLFKISGGARLQRAGFVFNSLSFYIVSCPSLIFLIPSISLNILNMILLYAVSKLIILISKISMDLFFPPPTLAHGI